MGLPQSHTLVGASKTIPFLTRPPPPPKKRLAGIMYAMKRGIRLKSGLVVVPSIDVLSAQLPTLRSSSGNSEARQLQASSHRGLCAVHRAIASIETMVYADREPVIEKLQIAAEISSSLEKFVSQYMSNASV